MEQEGGFSGPGGANDDEHVGGDACKVLIFHDILSPYKKRHVDTRGPFRGICGELQSDNRGGRG